MQIGRRRIAAACASSPRLRIGLPASSRCLSTRQDPSSSGGPSQSIWADKEMTRNVTILVSSQIMLNIGVSQVVPVLPILAAQVRRTHRC